MKAKDVVSSISSLIACTSAHGIVNTGGTATAYSTDATAAQWTVDGITSSLKIGEVADVSHYGQFIHASATINFGGDISIATGGLHFKLFAQSQVISENAGLVFRKNIYTRYSTVGRSVTSTFDLSSQTSFAKNSAAIGALNIAFNTNSNFDGGIQSGYIGFRLDKGGGTYFYGWAHVEWYPYIFRIVIDESKYTNSSGILAGTTQTVPEPAETVTGLALLALGAVGLRKLRKKEKAS